MNRRSFLESMAALTIVGPGSRSFLATLREVAPEELASEVLAPGTDHFLVAATTFSPVKSTVTIFAGETLIYVCPHSWPNMAAASEFVVGPFVLQRVPAGARLRIDGPPGSVAIATLVPATTGSGPFRSIDDLIAAATIVPVRVCLVAGDGPRLASRSE